MADAPQLSVVISVYNEQRFVRQAIESILSQTFADFELIVIDDGSDDATPNILEELRQRDDRIRIVARNHGGLIAALNYGLETAKAPLIARMDGDDVSMPTRFDRQVQFLAEHPEVAVVGTWMWSIDENGERIEEVRRPVSSDEVASTLPSYCCISHPTVMMRTEAVRGAGGYRPPFVHAEDYDLWLRLAENHKLANLRESLYERRIHAAQVSVRHLRQQVLSSLAAQAAATRRQKRRNDDDHIAIPTEASLQMMGVDRRTMHNAFESHYLHQAHGQLLLNHLAQTEQLLNELDAMQVKGDRAPEVWWMRSRLYRKQQRPARAIACAMRTILSDPLAVARRLVHPSDRGRNT